MEAVQSDQNKQPLTRLPSSSALESGPLEAFRATSRRGGASPPTPSLAPSQTKCGRHQSPSRARVRGVELGKGACSWVSRNSTMRLRIPVPQTRLGKTDLMLTMIPAQNGVSLTSREELMLAMRKPTTVTAMPRASCSSASSSGNRQPQHVRASSSPHSLGAPLPFFGPMSSDPAASAAGGPPCLCWPRVCLSLPMAAAWVGGCVCGALGPKQGAGRAEPALVFELRRLNKYGKHLELTR